VDSGAETEVEIVAWLAGFVPAGMALPQAAPRQAIKIASKAQRAA